MKDIQKLKHVPFKIFFKNVQLYVQTTIRNECTYLLSFSSWTIKRKMKHDKYAYQRWKIPIKQGLFSLNGLHAKLKVGGLICQQFDHGTTVLNLFCIIFLRSQSDLCLTKKVWRLSWCGQIPSNHTVRKTYQTAFTNIHKLTLPIL